MPSPSQWLSRRARIGIALVFACLALGMTCPGILAGQYFGRNKIHHHTFDFRVMRAPHFDIYFYPAESAATMDAARMAEQWYARHAAVFGDTFSRKPLILYADAPDFQQTNVISGFLGQGTGGVTEARRNRVVLPFTGQYGETNHVLGHEIVHVFQFDVASKRPNGLGRTVSAWSLDRAPLWMIEGLAEYLTLGTDDPNTAMWMRDAVLRNDIPTLKQLTNTGRYFPYRYGQALWGYIAGRWGERAIPALFRATLANGVDRAIPAVLSESSAALSADWRAALRAATLPRLQGRVLPESLGTRLLRRAAKGGDLDVSPALSPDGRFVAFITSRGLLQTDLYIADAESGDVVARLTGPNSDPEFDALSFIASAGSWSPDGRRLAYPVLAGGAVEIAIFNVMTRRVERQIRIPEMGAISDVAWGPADQLAVAGTSGALSDLVVYDLSVGSVEWIASGRYAALQPAWSPDGRRLAYVTDSGPESDFDRMRYGPMRIALVDLATHRTQLLPFFDRGKQINPQFSPDGQSLYCVADPDGFSDIYRLTLATGALSEVTRVATGVSGISALSPALSVARQTGRMMFSVYERAGFTLHRLDAVEARQGESVVTAAATTRAPARLLEVGFVDSTRDSLAAPPYPIQPYRPALALDYLGTAGVGVAFGPSGIGVGGGVGAVFSDMLSDHVLSAQVMVAGELEDIGAGVSYVNQRRRWIWGLGVSHTPYLSLAAGVSDTTVTTSGGGRVPALLLEQDRIRTFYEQGSVFTQYPLTMTRRLEFSGGYTRVHYSITVDQAVAVSGIVVASKRFGGPTPSALDLGQFGAAYVGDYSSFGFTSPIAGGRYRVEADPTLGSLLFATAQVDYRRYFFMNPLTVAFRALHYGRYGPDGDNRSLSPLTVGDPLLVRGYDVNSFDVSQCQGAVAGTVGTCPVFDRLIGTKLAVVNAELRIPVLGTEQLGLIPFPAVPLEVAPFVDAGVAWTGSHGPTLEFSTTSGDRIPVFSTGLSARVNVLGYIVLEGYYAYAFQRPGHHGQFGFQIAPGW